HGGRGSRWGSGVSEIRKRRVKVGHLHRHAAFRTSAKGKADPAARSTVGSGASGTWGLVPSKHQTSKPHRTIVWPALEVAAEPKGGMEAKRVGSSSRSR